MWFYSDDFVSRLTLHVSFIEKLQIALSGMKNYDITKGRAYLQVSPSVNALPALLGRSRHIRPPRRPCEGDPRGDANPSL
jgi:hypothetical protein